VYPQTAASMDERSGGVAIKAGELKPSTHSLQVLRLVSVPVKEVQFFRNATTSTESADAACKLAPSERVSLSVHQPERHSIFVASQPSGQGSMAVASSSIDAHRSTYHRYAVKNTFVAVPDEAECVPVRRRQRGSSVPATARLSRLSTCDHGASKPVASTHSARSIASSRASNMSCMSSVLSHRSKPGASSQVVLRMSGSVDRRFMGVKRCQNGPEAAVTLSEVLWLQSRGLQSIGTRKHCEGQCCPCLMQAWHNMSDGDENPPCKHGLLCDRCHAPHDKKDIKEIRTEGRRRSRYGAQPAGHHILHLASHLGL